MLQPPRHHCPTCTCSSRPRYTIDPELLEQIATAYRAAGVDEVQRVTGRSHSQAYRLIAQARREGVL